MLATLLSGAQDYKENVHLSLWTLKLLKVSLKRTGFHVIKTMGDSILKVLVKLLPSRCGNIGIIAVKVREL